MAEDVERFAVIGGGFIGTEIAAALANNGNKVVMIFPGDYLGATVFPEPLARFVSRYYTEKGVELMRRKKIVAAASRDKERVLMSSGGREVKVDAVVAGIGLEPNIELAQSAGLEAGNGIVVDHTFSSKPASGYLDYHEKMTTYVKILAGPAQAIDSNATGRYRSRSPP